MLEVFPIAYRTDTENYVDLKDKLIADSLLDETDAIHKYSFLPVVGLRIADLKSFDEYTINLRDFSDAELDGIGLWYLQSKYKVYTINILITIGKGKRARYVGNCGFVLYDIEKDRYRLINTENKALIFESLQGDVLYTFSNYSDCMNMDMRTKDCTGKMAICKKAYKEGMPHMPVIRFIEDAHACGGHEFSGIFLNYIPHKGFFINNLGSGVVLWTSFEDEFICASKSSRFGSFNNEKYYYYEECQRCFGSSIDDIVGGFAVRIGDFIKIGSSYVLVHLGNFIIGLEGEGYGEVLVVPSDCECLIVNSFNKLADFSNVTFPSGIKTVAMEFERGDIKLHRNCTLYFKKGTPSSVVLDYLLKDKLLSHCMKTAGNPKDALKLFNNIKETELITIDDVIKKIKNLPIKIKLY